jgi:hypothetical protein
LDNHSLIEIMAPDTGQYILAIDPGRAKCGLAVLDYDGNVIQKMVLPVEETLTAIALFVQQYTLSQILIGDGTGSDAIVKQAEQLLPGHISTVREKGTTLEARELAWMENPPGGIWRFLPTIFWPAPRDLDAWAAVVIGRRALSK